MAKFWELEEKIMFPDLGDLTLEALLTLLGEVLKHIEPKLPDKQARVRTKTFRTYRGLPNLVDEIVNKYKTYRDMGLLSKEEIPVQGDFLTYCLIAGVMVWDRQLKNKNLPDLTAETRDNIFQRIFFSKNFPKK